MKMNAKDIDPSVVAVISAAVSVMMGGRKGIAISIKRSDMWTIAGRHRLMI